MEPEIEVRKLGILMTEPVLRSDDDENEDAESTWPIKPIPCDVRYFYAPVTETHGMWFRSEVDAVFPPELIEREHARRLESFRERVRLAKAQQKSPLDVALALPRELGTDRSSLMQLSDLVKDILP